MSPEHWLMDGIAWTLAVLGVICAWQTKTFHRCSKTWECLDPDGHPGPCTNVKETD